MPYGTGLAPLERMRMRCADASRFFAHVLGAALLGCAGGDEGTTLAELRHAGVTASAVLERDACSCACGKLICWNFTCSGDGCGRADEYELSLESAGAGKGACLDAAGLTARLVGPGDASVDADAVTIGCREITLRWRGPRAERASQPHRVEIRDGSDTWAIDDPFSSASLAVISPPSAVSASPAAPGSVPSGQTIRFSVASPARLTDAGASLRSTVTHETIALALDAREDELAVSVPAGTPRGRYDLHVGAATLLPGGACNGPAVCRGLDVAATVALRVE